MVELIACLLSTLVCHLHNMVFNIEVIIFVFIFISFGDFRYTNTFVCTSPDPCRRERPQHSALHSILHCTAKELNEGRKESACRATVWVAPAGFGIIHLAILPVKPVKVVVEKCPEGNPRAKLSANHRYYCREIAEPEAFAKPGNEILVSFKADFTSGASKYICSGEMQGPYFQKTFGYKQV